MCLSVDEVERPVRGQALILKHGCLSWSRPTVTAAPLVICLRHQPSSETGEPSSHTPSLVAARPPGLASCTGCPVNTGLTGAMLFTSTCSFLLRRSRSLPVVESVSFSPCPFAPQKTAGVLYSCQEKERPHLFHCLSLSVSCT